MRCIVLLLYLCLVGLSPATSLQPVIAMTRHRNSPAHRAVHKAMKARKVLGTKLMEDLTRMQEMEDTLLESTLRAYIERKKASQVKSDAARRRKFRPRKSWASFQSNLTDRQFRRYFRMPRECFDLLCEKIEANVGEREFKSENYLHLFRGGYKDNDLRTTNIMRAHEATTGGFISGEVKLALTLRLLAGGSYLDLALLFETGQHYAYEIFHHVIKNWICDDRLVKINGLDYVANMDAMKAVALEFARASGGVINGCIGAIDGWVVKMKRPIS